MVRQRQVQRAGEHVCTAAQSNDVVQAVVEAGMDLARQHGIEVKLKGGA